jgi:hypothetical protein
MDHLQPYGQQSPQLSRRELDLAIGALMAIRGCSDREAFEEIADAVHQTSIGLGSHTCALLTLISGGSDESTHSGALSYWRALIGEPSAHRTLSA